MEEEKGKLVNPMFRNATTYKKKPNGKDNKEEKVYKDHERMTYTFFEELEFDTTSSWMILRMEIDIKM